MGRRACVAMCVVALLTLPWAVPPVNAGGGVMGCYGPIKDAATTSVEIKGLCFKPTIIRVNPGDTVT